MLVSTMSLNRAIWERCKIDSAQIGEYDKFLIKWNYTVVPDVNDSKEEADVLSNMVSEAIKNPVYRYGKQLSYALDPRSQTEDLGDDAIKASEYGIKNLKYLMANLNTWIDKDDEDFSYKSEIYDGVVYQYIRYINHIFASVGGIYLNEVKVSDGMVPFESVEKEKQKTSLEFIMKQIKQLDWLENKDLMKNLTIMGSAKDLMQTVLAKAVISSPSKVTLSSMIAENPYSFSECSEDVYNFIWEPTMDKKQLTPIEKYMQTEYLNTIMTTSNISKLVKGSGISDISAISEIKNYSLFEILKSEDKQLRYKNQLQVQNALEYLPTAGYGVPSTKFSVVFNTESNYYKYVLQTKQLLEKSMRKSGICKEDKLHYDLLLKKINSSLKVY